MNGAKVTGRQVKCEHFDGIADYRVKESEDQRSNVWRSLRTGFTRRTGTRYNLRREQGASTFADEDK
eukprot:COSAG01_NODE_29765_length_630_cov_0.917137_2_plen_67_part_00